MMLFLTTVPSPTPLNINNIVATTEVVSRTTKGEGGSAAIADKPQPTSIPGERENGCSCRQCDERSRFDGEGFAYTYYNFTCEWITIVISDKPLPTSIPGERGNDCTCSEATVIAVSAVSLLLIVTLTTVTLTQCLLIIRMRRSRDRSETYAEATNSTTKTTDVPVSLNEAYGMTKITTEEVTYELVK